MRTFAQILILILATSSFVNCQDSKGTNKKADSVELTSLTRAVYKWYETTIKPDFYYTVKDKFLTGIDWAKSKERFEEIEKTDFFDKEFLDNLREIAQQIDKYCKIDSAKYEDNLYPPWEDGVNDWCNCQMNPDNYWETLTISGLKDNGHSADFNWTWTWGTDFYYHVKATKNNGKWKVSYLQGLDKNEYKKNIERETTPANK